LVLRRRSFGHKSFGLWVVSLEPPLAVLAAFHRSCRFKASNAKHISLAALAIAIRRNGRDARSVND